MRISRLAFSTFLSSLYSIALPLLASTIIILLTLCHFWSLLVMESSGQSDVSKQALVKKPAHVYKKFRASGDYSAFEAEIVELISSPTSIHPSFQIFPCQFLMHRLIVPLNLFIVLFWKRTIIIPRRIKHFLIILHHALIIRLMCPSLAASWSLGNSA
jgi:hypothetical protein